MSDPSAHEPDDDLRELREIRAALGTTGPERLEAPPDALWDRIAAAVDLGEEPDEDTTVVPLHRRARPTAWVIGAAAAVVVVIAGFVAITRDDTSPTLLASSDLDRLQGDTAVGSAELLDEAGTLQLRLDTTGLDAGDGFLEVWMIDPDVTQLVSLGPLRPDGIYDLPAGMDAAAFPIVDVSIEPLDGDPTHSGNSVLRGQLEF